MIDLGHWAETLGLRRKKSFVERVQDAAEDVVEGVVDSVMPVLAKPAKMARSVREMELPDVRMPSLSLPSMGVPSMPSMPRIQRPDLHVPDVRLPKVQLPDMHLPEVHLPDVHFANGHLAKLRAGELAEDVTDKIRHGAAATGSAASGAAAGIGGFFGTIFSWLWSATMFVVKAALLAGVAYGGWKWLQSRKRSDTWQGGSSATPYDASTYTSSVYGSVTGSDAPAAVGTR